MLFVVIMAVVAYFVIKSCINLAENGDFSHLLRYKKEKYDELETKYLKQLSPQYENLLALYDYYKAGNKELTPIQVKKFLSFPQYYKINEKDELIVNGVNLGDAKNNVLLSKGDRYEILKGKNVNYPEIKNELIIENKWYANNYESLYYGLADEKDFNNCGAFVVKEKINKVYNRSIKYLNYENEKFKEYKLYDLLPNDFKLLYDDINKNVYSSKELKQKYIELYDKINKEYDEYIGEKEAIKLKNLINSSGINKYYDFRNIGGYSESGKYRDKISKQGFGHFFSKEAIDEVNKYPLERLKKYGISE